MDADFKEILGMNWFAIIIVGFLLHVGWWSFDALVSLVKSLVRKAP